MSGAANGLLTASMLMSIIAGVDYFFFQHMEGRSAEAPLELEPQDLEKCTRTIRHYAQFSTKLHDHPFNKMGSLYPSVAGSNVWTGIARVDSPADVRDKRN